MQCFKLALIRADQFRRQNDVKSKRTKDRIRDCAVATLCMFKSLLAHSLEVLVVAAAEFANVPRYVVPAKGRLHNALQLRLVPAEHAQRLGTVPEGERSRKTRAEAQLRKKC